MHTMRLAVRSLSRARGTAAIAMATLAIGLAASVSLMGMIDSGARSLPVPDGDRIVEIELRDAHAARVDAPAPLDEWTRGPGVLDAGALRQIEATLVHPDAGALRLGAAAMHPSVLRLLRVAPALGRLPSDDAADADALVVAWAVFEELGADRALLGSAVRLDGAMHTLVGVMPAGFGFPERHSFWTVLPRGETGEIVARLDPRIETGVAAEALRSRINAVAAARGAERLPYRVDLEGWTHSRESGGEGALFVVLGVLVALLLAVCAANVSTLLLVRGEERARVLAVHAALGAGRARVGGQLLAEAAIVAVGGGALGLAGGFALLRWMQANLSQHWGYYWMTMEVRPPVLLGTFALIVIVSVIAGTAPALQAMRVDVARLLVGTGRGGHDPRRRRLGRWFVGAQVALSTIGLVVTVYLAWGATRLDVLTERLPLDRVAIASITLPEDRYVSAAERDALAAALRTELRRIPGVRAVNIGTSLPGGAGGGAAARLVLPSDDRTGDPTFVLWDAVDEGLAETYGMRLVAGRWLRAADDANAAPVVMVTTGTAQRHFGGRAVGERLRLEGVHGEAVWAEVVGVVENWIPERAGRGSDRVILPLGQAAPKHLTLSVGAADPRVVLPDIRRAVARVDRELPLDELQTLQARMDWFLRMSRVIAAFGVFGGLASALVTAVGLYGVIAFQVRSRTREIGVRMAVGAGTSRIIALFLGEMLRRVVPGLAVGFAAALLIAPFVARFVSSDGAAPDAALLSAVVAGMLCIGAAAAIEPALRAARLDPQIVLRGE